MINPQTLVIVDTAPDFVEVEVPHTSHAFEASYGSAVCAKCGTSTLADNGRLGASCPEEPYYNPADAGDAWTGGFAENH